MGDGKLFTYERIRLEKIIIELHELIDRKLLNDVIIDYAVDSMTRAINLRVRGHVWGERVPRQKIEYPADWWQAFKMRWFPEWALRRWPVVMNVEYLDVTAIYPDFHPSLYEHKAYMIIERCGFNERRYGGFFAHIPEPELSNMEKVVEDDDNGVGIA